MHHVFVKKEQLTKEGKVLRITGEDFHHIVRVLRMKEGEELTASVLAEYAAREEKAAAEYRFGIEEITEDSLICRLRFVKEESRELPAQITLLQCLPKSDKMELIVQKAVELGVHEVIPVSARRSVVRLEDKKAEAKRGRWQKIAEAAAMQSKRGIIPEIRPVQSVKDAIAAVAAYDLKLIPYELAAYEGMNRAQDAEGEARSAMNRTRELMQGIRAGQRIAVFIGPEGGFEEAEVEQAKEAGFHAITLGKRILRTETAGPAVLAWLMFLLEE
ncbi:MAG: 16S rRNA (uracil(1498)-N(3))-methyltransferase [Lachnospiraceae bacterium]|nr:16S rRNA (uracil(1498)-N(3))-methyltransferase [Lachnospiraceae bacterium]